MAINYKEEGNQAVITTDCYSLSKDEATEFKAIAVELIEKGFSNIVLDMSKTEYVDSSGIGKMLFLNKMLINKEGKLTIKSITPKLYQFLESLAIDKVIDINDPQ